MLLSYRQTTRLRDWTNAILADTSMNDVVSVKQTEIVGRQCQCTAQVDNDFSEAVPSHECHSGSGVLLAPGH
jgi:hypothetical protein